MRVILTHDFADDLGALAGRPVRREPKFLHSVEDAAMDRFKTVANIGEGASHDYAHGVIEVAPAHLVFDVDRYVDAVVSASPARGSRKIGLFGRRRILRIVLICQS